MCGDYTGGRLKAAGANAVRPLCATIYNCSDPEECWLEDVATGAFRDTENGVANEELNIPMIYWIRAVSVMPGCNFVGEQTKDNRTPHGYSRLCFTQCNVSQVQGAIYAEVCLKISLRAVVQRSYQNWVPKILILQAPPTTSTPWWRRNKWQSIWPTRMSLRFTPIRPTGGSSKKSSPKPPGPLVRPTAIAWTTNCHSLLVLSYLDQW